MNAEHGTPLMVEGEWELLALTEVESAELKSYIVHDCPNWAVRKYWWMVLIMDKACTTCHKHPPNGMLGLWKLHNWQYIQSNS